MYKNIDLKNWTKVGEGNNADTYTCAEDDTVLLKVNRRGKAGEARLMTEFELGKKVLSMGIQAPEVYEMVTVGDTIGILFQNIKGKKSYSRLIADNPENMAEYANRFAKAAKALHETPCNTELFNNKRDELKEGIEKARFLGPYKERLQKIVDDIEDRTTCLHGDLHTGNLINAEGRDYWIDFDGFAYGNPIIDLAHMYTIYRGNAHNKIVQNIVHMNEKQLNRFWDLFLGEYYGFNKEEADAFSRKIEIYYAIVLAQRNASRKGILAFLIELLLIKPKVKKYFKDIQVRPEK